MKPINAFSVILMILALTACAQTTATKTASPPQPETRQTPPAGGQASTEMPESGQPEPQNQSKIGETRSAEPASGQTEAPRSTAAAASAPQESEHTSSTGPAGRQDSVEAKLAHARKNLRISRETEKRIAAELEQLKNSGSASDKIIKDYETYLASVTAMTAENQKLVTQMEAAYAKKSSAKAGSGELDNLADPDIPEAQITDDVAALDRRLNASLAKFDGMLLEEMDKIRAGSSKKLQNLAEEAAEAARRLRNQGLDVDTSAGNQEEGAVGRSSGRDVDSEGGRQGSETASSDKSGKGGEGPSRTNQRQRDYEDDDIVARQLREAAENETDPELKEKLWKEYEEYKKSK